ETFHFGVSTSTRFAETEEEDGDDEEEGEAFKWDFILQSPLLTPRSNAAAAEYMGFESGRQALSPVPAFSTGKGKEIASPQKQPLSNASMFTDPVGANESITDNPINREFKVYVDELPALSRQDSV